MQCPEAALRLPELLTGALTPAERAELELHMAGCEACRMEWDETRLGALVFESHLPSSVVAALAWDRPLGGFDPDVARRHLEACAECAEDLALARECRTREAAAPVVQPASRRSWLRSAGFASGLAASFVGGLLLGSRATERGLAAGRQAAAEQAARLAAEAERLRVSESELRARLARLAAPRPNLPLIELSSDTARDPASHEATLLLGPGDTLAALVFSAPGARPPLAVELRDEQGHALWRGEGLRPNPLGGYVLGVPAELLPQGRFTLALLPERGGPAFARLAFQVSRSR